LYQEVEDGAGTVKAETCDNCHGYVKVLYQTKDPDLEPLNGCDLCWNKNALATLASDPRHRCAPPESSTNTSIGRG
jgi:hypothetical protein